MPPGLYPLVISRKNINFARTFVKPNTNLISFEENAGIYTLHHPPVRSHCDRFFEACRGGAVRIARRIGGNGLGHDD